MAGFQFVSPDIAIDIGTDNTRVYVKDKGIVVNEPSVVITRGENTRNNIVAVGDSAEEMIGRSGGNIRVIHPLRDGVIVDYEMAQIIGSGTQRHSHGRTVRLRRAEPCGGKPAGCGAEAGGLSGGNHGSGVGYGLFMVFLRGSALFLYRRGAGADGRRQPGGAPLCL